jgi:hypothetical protein
MIPTQILNMVRLPLEALGLSALPMANWGATLPSSVREGRKGPWVGGWVGGKIHMGMDLLLAFEN